MSSRAGGRPRTREANAHPVIKRIDRTTRVRSVGRSDRPVWSSVLIISPAVAGLYAVLGLVTLGLTQMTGLAAPIWPAAGVAFTAVLHWGWRALPGVFLGAFGVNVLWLTRLSEAELRTVLFAAVVGVGTTVGAATGAGLVRRFVGPVRGLDTPRAVMLTLSLGGLLGTLIAPSTGVAVQLTAGLLSTGQAASVWLTWWVGDSIGVIVFAPLALMMLPSQSEYWAGRRWKIAAPSLLIVGILLTAIIENVAHERIRIDSAVKQLGTEAISDLTRNVDLHHEVLEGVRGLMDASSDVTAKEFRTYTGDALNRLPSLQALSWNPLVTAADLDAFVASQRKQPGLGNFSVTQRGADGNLQPVAPRPEYVVVAYIEPIAKNRSALGFDIYSNPARAAAVVKARDTGQPAATAPIDLVQDSGTQKGALALVPIYRDASHPADASARRAALRGFAVGVYRLGDMLAETFRGDTWDGVDLTLADVTDRANPVVIADLPARNAAPQGSTAPPATTLPLDFYGRRWELTVRPTSAEFVDNRSGVMAIVLLAALAMTYLLEAFLLLISGMESLARRLIPELSSAAGYVESILPGDLEDPIPVTSRYIPSKELGGDSFDYRWIDDDHLIAYLVDVSGHGIGPAMFSVSVHNLLRSGSFDNDTLRDPGRVLTELNRLFQMDQQAGNYFTVWYGVYQPSTRTLTYASAGHPPALVLSHREPAGLRATLGADAIPVGVLEDTEYTTKRYTIPPDAEVLLYSDGAYELDTADGRHWSQTDFVDHYSRRFDHHDSLDEFVDELRATSRTGAFEDDCTLVRLRID